MKAKASKSKTILVKGKKVKVNLGKKLPKRASKYFPWGWGGGNGCGGAA
jgi:hypothetical protein